MITASSVDCPAVVDPVPVESLSMLSLRDADSFRTGLTSFGLGRSIACASCAVTLLPCAELLSVKPNRLECRIKYIAGRSALRIYRREINLEGHLTLLRNRQRLDT